MESRVSRIAAAGLLHDIGKFWQRTGTPRPYGREEADHFGNVYAHALWSGQFLERYLEDPEATPIQGRSLQTTLSLPFRSVLGWYPG